MDGLPIGRTGFNLAAAVHMRVKYVRVELYISGEDANQYLDVLEKQRDEIERELGFSLEWGDQSPEARDRRISHYLRDVNLEDKADWQRQHNWIADHLNKMHDAFVDRVKNA